MSSATSCWPVAASVTRQSAHRPAGPQLVPGDYSVVGDSIVFRTTPYRILGIYAWNTQIAFEVAFIDHERQQGWSVVATGRGSRVEDPDDSAFTWPPLCDPRAWGGVPRRVIYVRLRWTEPTGRRPGSDSGLGLATASSQCDEDFKSCWMPEMNTDYDLATIGKFRRYDTVAYSLPDEGLSPNGTLSTGRGAS
jgi:uncharacterized protein